jgi:hypothetical protein
MSDKFRVWDSIQLHETVKHSIQFRAKLEQLCIENNQDLTELPDSLVPSVILYMLVASNEAMFNKLLEQDLLKTLNPKQNPNIH